MGHSWARSVQVRHFARLFTVNVEVAVCQTYLVWGFIGKVKPDQSTTNQQTAGRADVPGPHPERPPQGSPAAHGPRLWSRHLRACSWRLPSSRLRGLPHAIPRTPLWVPCAPCLTMLWGPQPLLFSVFIHQESNCPPPRLTGHLMKPFHFLSALCPSPALPCYTNYDPKQPHKPGAFVCTLGVRCFVPAAP